MKTKSMFLIQKALSRGLEDQAVLFSREALEHFDPAKQSITLDIMRLSFKNLGVDFDETPGKKWYQLFSNNMNEKFLNALSLIPTKS